MQGKALMTEHDPFADSHPHEHPDAHPPAHSRGADACCSGHTATVALPIALARARPAVAGSAAGAQVQTPIRILQMDCPTEEALLRNYVMGVGYQ